MANAFVDVPVGAWEDGSELSGVELRRSGLVAVAGGQTTLSARGGVRPVRNATLSATLPGGMFLRVTPGVAVIPTASEGCYVVTLPATQDIPVTAANATNPRIDTFGAEVVPGSPTTWRFRMLDGTPNASPVAPTYAGTGVFLPLWDVRVNAAVSAPTSVTDRRQFTVAPGGVIPQPGLMALATATRTSLAAGMPLGQPLWDPDVNALVVATSGRSLMPIVQDPTFSDIVVNTTPSATLTTGTLTTYTAANKTFTAPRSGWCYQGADIDAQGVGIFGSAHIQVCLSGNSIPDGNADAADTSTDGIPILFGGDANARVPYRYRPRVPYWVNEGQGLLLGLRTRSFFTGGWKINSMTWKIAII